MQALWSHQFKHDVAPTMVWRLSACYPMCKPRRVSTVSSAVLHIQIKLSTLGSVSSWLSSYDFLCVPRGSPVFHHDQSLVHTVHANVGDTTHLPDMNPAWIVIVNVWQYISETVGIPNGCVECYSTRCGTPHTHTHTRTHTHTPHKWHSQPGYMICQWQNFPARWCVSLHARGCYTWLGTGVKFRLWNIYYVH